MSSCSDRSLCESAHRREHRGTKSHNGGAVNYGGERLRIGGGKTEIFVACAAIAVPMLLLSVLLLGIILCNSLQQHPKVSNTFRHTQAADSDDAAFYVNFSATELITAASWTSSIAPVLPTFFMALLSRSTAQKIMRLSEIGQYSELPTPYQLSLLLSILGAEIGSLWQYMRYKRWKQRDNVVKAVHGALLLLILTTLMG